MRILLYACVGLTAAAAAGCGFGVPNPPLPVPGIQKERQEITKRILALPADIGAVLEMAHAAHVLDDPASADWTYALCSEDKALYIDDALEVVREVEIEGGLGEARMRRFTPEGAQRYLSWTTWHSSHICDAGGNLMWSFSPAPGINALGAGDFDGDGELDFVAVCNGGGGIIRLDPEGNEIWQKDDGNVWHVECADIDGDGRDEIIHSNAGGQLRVRDSGGRIIHESRPAGYFSGFSLSTWITRRNAPHVIHPGDGIVYVYAPTGQQAAKLSAPFVHNHTDVCGAVVTFEPGGPPYYAVAADHEVRASVFIYDYQENLVFHDVIEMPARSILAAPRKDGPGEDLLIGSKNKLIRYHWEEPKES